MTLLGTRIVIDGVKVREPIREDITARRFSSTFPVREDFMLAHRIQLELPGTRSPRAFADMLIAAIAVNRDEEIITRDRDFTLYVREALRDRVTA